ncbi:MAG TPA: acylphosphatase [Candidatus Babeliales bacterium]|nr:acylphosphatase [Candidatus Babeliales bacterium]
MNKCLKITFSGDIAPEDLRTFIQKHAHDLSLEGTVQLAQENQYRIFVCGAKDAVDTFVDILHKGSAKIMLEDIEIEPFVRTKDYRGVFRVIE